MLDLYSELSDSPSADRPLAFSYSKYSLYGECPRKYKFKYIEKIPEKPKSYFSFGSAVHSALEFLYSSGDMIFPPLEAVLNAFELKWKEKDYKEKGYVSQRKADEDLVRGKAMLEAYYEHKGGNFEPAFKVEYSADVQVDGLLVRIIADNIRYHDGLLTLTDYKTGKDVKRTPEQLYMYQKILEIDPQLREMAAAAYGAAAGKLKIDRMIYYHVPTNKEYFFDRAGDAEIGTFWESVLSAADGVRSMRFDPRPECGRCRWCDYRPMCPAYSEDLAECDFLDKRIVGEETAGSGLQELADRYGLLMQKKNDIEKELEETRRAILSLSPSGAAEGKEYAVEITESEKWEASDRRRVLDILRARGVEEKAKTVTMSGIVSLLSREDVDSGTKDELRIYLSKKTVKNINAVKNRQQKENYG